MCICGDNQTHFTHIQTAYMSQQNCWLKAGEAKKTWADIRSQYCFSCSADIRPLMVIKCSQMIRLNLSPFVCEGGCDAGVAHFLFV